MFHICSLCNEKYLKFKFLLMNRKFVGFTTGFHWLFKWFVFCAQKKEYWKLLKQLFLASAPPVEQSLITSRADRANYFTDYVPFRFALFDVWYIAGSLLRHRLLRGSFTHFCSCAVHKNGAAWWMKLKYIKYINANSNGMKI